MENSNRFIYEQAKAEMKEKVRTMAGIALFWFILLKIFLLGSDGVSNWKLAMDAVTASEAFYIPYRVGHRLTGTPVGGAVVSVVILYWMSTWFGEHMLLGWVLIIGGYVIDFGPCVFRMMQTWRR